MWVIQKTDGWWLTSGGWGPTFTEKRADAKTFPSEKSALEYKKRNLQNLDVSVVRN